MEREREREIIYAPYMTVYLVISLPKLPYVHCIYGAGQPY